MHRWSIDDHLSPRQPEGRGIWILDHHTKPQARQGPPAPETSPELLFFLSFFLLNGSSERVWMQISAALSLLKKIHCCHYFWTLIGYVWIARLPLFFLTLQIYLYFLISKLSLARIPWRKLTEGWKDTNALNMNDPIINNIFMSRLSVDIFFIFFSRIHRRSTRNKCAKYFAYFE